MKNWKENILAPLVFTIVLLVLWEIACRLFNLPATVLPTPTAIAKAMVQYWPAIWENSLQTLMTTLLGFGLAIVFGLALGIGIGWSKFIYGALYPVMIAFNAIPKVAVVPILIIWFGIGTIPAIFT